MSNKTKRLTTDLSTFAPGALADELYRLAHNIEEALLLMGAEPEKDYTALDLVREAGRYLRTDASWKEMELDNPLEPRGQVV